MGRELGKVGKAIGHPHKSDPGEGEGERRLGASTQGCCAVEGQSGQAEGESRSQSLPSEESSISHKRSCLSIPDLLGQKHPVGGTQI